MSRKRDTQDLQLMQDEPGDRPGCFRLLRLRCGEGRMIVTALQSMVYANGYDRSRQVAIQLDYAQVAELRRYLNALHLPGQKPAAASEAA
jgi:hypothetical protein